MHGKRFNTHRLHAKTKMHEYTTRDFLFVEDCALNASTQYDMQGSVDQFSKACKNFGLKISTKKIEVLHQPATTALYIEPNITIIGQGLEVADKLIYFSITPSRPANIDEKVAYRIIKSSATFGRLKDKVWERRRRNLKKQA